VGFHSSPACPHRLLKYRVPVRLVGAGVSSGGSTGSLGTGGLGIGTDGLGIGLGLGLGLGGDGGGEAGGGGGGGDFSGRVVVGPGGEGKETVEPTVGPHLQASRSASQ